MSMHSSAVVYTYADRFLEQRAGRGGVALPCRDVRVKKRELAPTAVTAAVVGLVKDGRIRLSLGQRRALLGLRKQPTVLLDRTGGAAPDTGIEGAILDSLSRSDGPLTIPKLVETMLPLSGDPWGTLIGLIEEDMLEQGYFSEGERGRAAQFFLGKKLEPDCQRILELERHVEPTRQMVASFRQANGTLYDQLVKDLRRAIRSRQEADVDVDF